MTRLLTSLPVWIILADMLYGFILNVSKSLDLHQSSATSNSDITPDIAFSGLQALSNGGMILIIGFGLVVLLQLNRSVIHKRILSIGIFRTLGLLAVLAFSLPSLWEWFHTLAALPTNLNLINFSNPRYLITALCMPLIAFLSLYRLYGWYRLSRAGEVTPVQNTLPQ